MSVHLYLRTRTDWRNHPEWEPESSANGGHKHFARNVMGTLPREDVRSNDDPYDFDWLTRPTDFAAWRAAIAADPELEGSNLPLLVDLLEREPDRWLYVSQ